MSQILFLDPHSPPALPPHILTIGNFDGVHLGHEAMLKTLKKDAALQALATAVMIFEPQPKEFFDPPNAPARLFTLQDKLAHLGVLVDYVIVANFDQSFRELSAHDFCQMLGQLNTKGLVVGDDFRFGHDRQGDKTFLKKQGFAIHSLDSVLVDGVRVSSTAVRQALSEGDLDTAKRLLGRDYAITGQVVHGDKIGRTLNFPTANIALSHLKPAIKGIFGADIVAYKDGQVLDLYQLGGGIQGKVAHSLFGAVNVGTRPSVSGTDYRLEVHLPCFTGDLYGLTLQVIFKKYLHDERHYAGLDELKTGIKKDVDELVQWHLSRACKLLCATKNRAS